MEIILKDTNLILTPTPTWIQYEGTFRFTYVCPEGSKDCLDNEEKLLKRMTKEIKLKYPGEKFELEGTGGSSFLTVESSGKAYMSDECFKMALPDAISIACKAIGFGADVYYAKDRTKYDVVDDKPKATPKATKLNCNELITVGFAKGYKAEAIEKMCIKKFGHGLEFINQEELTAMVDGFKGLPDKE
jgi:hypothetical protein